MTAVLLALLVGQPTPDEAARVARDFAARLSEAYRVSREDPERAIRLTTDLLDDPKARALEARSPAIHAYREQAFYLRGQLRVRRGEPGPSPTK